MSVGQVAARHGFGPVPPPPPPRWTTAEPPRAERVRQLKAGLGLPRALCELLAVRGFDSLPGARNFLRPRIEHLHDPGRLADADAAATRVAEAVVAEEIILVHGDYDVDGMCATALLTRWLRSLGARVRPFVPARNDGYDLGRAGLAQAREHGATLVITADCGTKAHEAVSQAATEGIDVVVTDHHAVEDGDLPAAVAILNPHRPDCAYPGTDLCGAGIAYKLCQLVASALGRGGSGVGDSAPVEYLDLVALATVADLVPLRGENRVLTHYGLRRLADSRVVGLRALMEVADVDPATVGAGHLGFQLGPRLNAAGRMGDSMDGVRLLLTDDRNKAMVLAGHLDALNRRRREEVSRIEEEALHLIGRDHGPASGSGLVVAGKGWPSGVIGIVASRLVDRLYRPAVVVTLDRDPCRGSARSVPGFDLYSAIAECQRHLERFGGHPAAAGLDVRRDRLSAFRDAFADAANKRLTPDLLRPVLRLDMEIELSEAEESFVRWLRYLGPHGRGNPSPLFLARGVELTHAEAVKENHLRVRLEQGGASLPAIGFNMVEDHPPATLGGHRFDVAFRLKVNEWRGYRSVQAELRALHRSGVR